MDIFSQYPTLSNAVVDSTTEIYSELLTKLKLLRDLLQNSKEKEIIDSDRILQLKGEIQAIRVKLLDLENIVAAVENRAQILHEIVSEAAATSGADTESS
jgi:hypothetical protein